jgi:hypothetical protein
MYRRFGGAYIFGVEEEAKQCGDEGTDVQTDITSPLYCNSIHCMRTCIIENKLKVQQNWSINKCLTGKQTSERTAASTD